MASLHAYVLRISTVGLFLLLGAQVSGQTPEGALSESGSVQPTSPPSAPPNQRVAVEQGESAAPDRPDSSQAADPSAVPRRRALLIGVKTYRPADYQLQGLDRIMFSNLATTCEGVTAISARLQALGWSYDPQDPNSEIQEYCDADPDRLLRIIRTTVSQFNAPNNLLIIYLAGHGVEVEGKNYFFAPNAEVNVLESARLLAIDRQNLLFVGQAFDLETAILRPAGRFYLGNILVILDTCRNDIVFETMGRELRVAAGAPQTEMPPTGVSILYANTPGARITDGVGLSFLARAFDREVNPGMRVDTVASRIRNFVINETRALPTDRIQRPIRVNDLNNTDICLAGCALFAETPQGRNRAPPAGGARSHATRKTPHGYAAKTVSSSSEELPSVRPLRGDSAEPQSVRGFVTHRAGPPAESGSFLVSVDIYWCEGSRERDRARQIGSVVDGLRVADGIRPRGWPEWTVVRLGDVRSRGITREENGRPEFRITSNVARIAEDSDPAAFVAAVLRGHVPFPIRTQRLRSRSSTIDVFLCEGSPPFPRQDRLWVQVARSDQRGIATFLAGVAESEIPNLWVADAIDVEDASPNETQVRYFFPSERATASAIADKLSQFLPARPRVFYLPQYARQAGRGLIELWIGSNLNPNEVARSAEQ